MVGYCQGSDQEDLLGEPSPEAESFEAGAVAGFTCEDQKPAVLPNEIIGNLEVLLVKKLFANSMVINQLSFNEYKLYS